MYKFGQQNANSVTNRALRAAAAGQRVVSVEVLASKYAGEKKVFLRGNVNTRLIEAKRVRN